MQGSSPHDASHGSTAKKQTLREDSSAHGGVLLHTLRDKRRASVAIYDSIKHVHRTIKMLNGAEFKADEYFILCDDDQLREGLFAEQLTPDAPRRNRLRPWLVSGGAVFGCLAFGLGGLLITPLIGAITAILGACSGAAVGGLLADESGGASAAAELYATCRHRLGRQRIAVAVVAQPGEPANSPRLIRASQAMAQMSAA